LSFEQLQQRREGKLIPESRFPELAKARIEKAKNPQKYVLVKLHSFMERIDSLRFPAGGFGFAYTNNFVIVGAEGKKFVITAIRAIRVEETPTLETVSIFISINHKDGQTGFRLGRTPLLSRADPVLEIDKEIVVKDFQNLVVQFTALNIIPPPDDLHLDFIVTYDEWVEVT